MDEIFKPLLSGTTPSPPKFNVIVTWSALAPMDEKNQTPNITFANTRAETLRFGGAGVQRSACCRVWIFCPSTAVPSSATSMLLICQGAVTCCDHVFILLSVSNTLRTAFYGTSLPSGFVFVCPAALHSFWGFARLHTRQPGSVGLPECAWLCQQPADIRRDLKRCGEMWRTKTSETKHTMNSRNARQTPVSHSVEMKTRQHLLAFFGCPSCGTWWSWKIKWYNMFASSCL